ncbi:MAG: VWA domain-containing protein [Planctomycetota bacterium]|nr:VWA domain-containing protein [Planctomycetota bacterium]
MSFTFLEPAWLLLGLAIPAIWFLPRRVRGREAVETALLRSLVLALVVVALAKPASLTSDDTNYQILLVDRSASMDAGALQRADAMAAHLEETAGDDTEFHSVSVGSDQAVSASPLGDGLWRAARSIPAGYPGAVTLISDGRATDRRWGQAVAELSSRGIPVHTWNAVAPGVDARIVDLAPLASSLASPRVGTTLTLQASIADAPDSFDLVLIDGDKELARESFERTQDASVTLANLQFEPAAPGFLPITVRLESESDLGRAENDSLATTLAIGPPLEALYVGSRMARGSEALSKLVGPGFNFTQVAASDMLDGGLTPDRLAGTDLVVLDDTPAAAISNDTLEAITNAVTESGTGLFASGGSGAFGPGGWHKTPIEDLLPIEFVQKEEKRDPSTTLVIIIDTSGSMGGQRVQLAKEVSRLAIRRLLPHDKVGLVEFYGAKRWAVPIQPASNAIEIERALNRLNAGGGTVILPAIEEAFYGLKNVRTRYKHVLILTDGGVETGAFEPLLRNMSEDGINVSTVLIGSAAHSEFLVTLANWGKGRFYGVPNRFNLPEILLKQPTTAKLPALRPGPHTVSGRGGPAWWGDVDSTELPQLGAYVETSIKPGAHKVIETEGEGHPVLASWNNGLGRVTTLTTEPTGPASADWQQWPGYGPMLARALEQTARDSEPFRFTIERDDWRIRITARSRFGDSGPAFPGAKIAGGPADEGRGIAFRRLAPGWFEAEFFADPATELRLNVGDLTGAAGLKGLAVSPAFSDVSREFAVDPTRDLDLALLAQQTGGVHGALSQANLESPELPSTGGGDAPLRRRALWPLALLLALGAYLIEILNRRLVNGLFGRGRSSVAGDQA